MHNILFGFILSYFLPSLYWLFCRRVSQNVMSADDLVRKRCRDREEYYQHLRNYERKIEQDRLEHEQDLRNYERKIEQDRIKHEQAIAKKDTLIQHLLAENEALKKQEI